MGPLDGLKVLELGGFISAPFCGLRLTDLGAQVTKVETPRTGDSSRWYGGFLQDSPSPDHSALFHYLNRGKLGITLDVSIPAGQELLRRLVNTVDVVVENFQPGFLANLGLNYERLSELNPRLVMASITPFGQWGPYSGYRAHDINVAAASGISPAQGSPNREPLTFPTPFSGFQAGLSAACATVSALLDRLRTGKGQHIDISEAETIASIHTGPEALFWMYEWRRTDRGGHRGLDAPYPNCILRCKDGWVHVSASRQASWQKLLRLMGDPKWGKDPRFEDRTKINDLYGDEVDGYIEQWLADYTQEELGKIGEEEGLGFIPIKTISEVAQDERFSQCFVQLSSASLDGLRVIAPPFKFFEAAARVSTPAPSLGQDNHQVYADELRLDRDYLVQLYEAGVI